MGWKDQKDKRGKGRDGGKESGITSVEEKREELDCMLLTGVIAKPP